MNAGPSLFIRGGTLVHGLQEALRERRDYRFHKRRSLVHCVQKELDERRAQPLHGSGGAGAWSARIERHTSGLQGPLIRK